MQQAAGSKKAGSMQRATGRRSAGSMQRAAGSKKSIIHRLLSYCPLPAARCLLFSRPLPAAARCLLSLLLPAACCLLLQGCGSPNAANIQLRKENQQLTTERDQLTLQHTADLASIQASEGKTGTRPAMTIDRLNKLFTAHDLSLGRLTGGHQPAASSFDDGLIVYAVPTDDQGEPIKVAGTFNIDAYDLQEPNHPLVGQWSFDLAQARDLFYAHFSIYSYVLQLPWQKIPPHHQVTIHVTFTDELTGRHLTAQKVVTVNPPPSSTTAPSATP
jgi:hypothetical protein